MCIWAKSLYVQILLHKLLKSKRGSPFGGFRGHQDICSEIWPNWNFLFWTYKEKAVMHIKFKLFSWALSWYFQLRSTIFSLFLIAIEALWHLCVGCWGEKFQTRARKTETLELDSMTWGDKTVFWARSLGRKYIIYIHQFLLASPSDICCSSFTEFWNVSWRGRYKKTSLGEGFWTKKNTRKEGDSK